MFHDKTYSRSIFVNNFLIMFIFKLGCVIFRPNIQTFESHLQITRANIYQNYLLIRKFLFQTAFSKCLIWATLLWDWKKLARCVNTTKQDSAYSEKDVEAFTTMNSVETKIIVMKIIAIKDIQKFAGKSISQEIVGTTQIVPTNTLHY